MSVFYEGCFAIAKHRAKEAVEIIDNNNYTPDAVYVGKDYVLFTWCRNRLIESALWEALRKYTGKLEDDGYENEYHSIIVCVEPFGDEELGDLDYAFTYGPVPNGEHRWMFYNEYKAQME